MNKYQNTISKSVEFSGIGLHSGEKSKVVLIPASVDTGIIFKVNNSSIQASWSNAIISQLCTKIKKKIFQFRLLNILWQQSADWEFQI